MVTISLDNSLSDPILYKIRHEPGRRRNKNVVGKSQRLVHIAGYSRTTTICMEIADRKLHFMYNERVLHGKQVSYDILWNSINHIESPRVSATMQWYKMAKMDTCGSSGII